MGSWMPPSGASPPTRASWAAMIATPCDCNWPGGVWGAANSTAALLRGDSSVVALAEQGWIALYRGDLRGATDAFRAAGPYAGERAAATERTAMLALVQQISADPLPELGAALLTLARGDSAGAITALRRVASQLEPAGGRSDLLLLAGQVAARLGGGGLQDSTAARLFEQA